MAAFLHLSEEVLGRKHRVAVKRTVTARMLGPSSQKTVEMLGTVRV